MASCLGLVQVGGAWGEECSGETEVRVRVRVRVRVQVRVRV